MLARKSSHAKATAADYARHADPGLIDGPAGILRTVSIDQIFIKLELGEVIVPARQIVILLLSKWPPKHLY
jgi:hypothetical protein